MQVGTQCSLYVGLKGLPNTVLRRSEAPFQIPNWAQTGPRRGICESGGHECRDRGEGTSGSSAMQMMT